MDILFLALMAAYIIYKLYLTLGEERSMSHEISLDSLSKQEQMKNATIKTLHESLSDEEKVKLVDKNFHLNDFLQKSEKAIDIIFKALTEGNTAIISDLSEIDIVRRFALVISELEDKKLELNISELKLKNTKLSKTIIHENYAELSVKYKAECEMFILKKRDELFAGNRDKVNKFDLEASFTKDLRSKDPTWKLSKINFIPFEKELNV